MVVKEGTATCTKCKGTLRYDGDADEMVCFNCGRRSDAPAARVAGEITITIAVKPSNFADLVGAVAMSKGASPAAYLQRFGLSKRQAGQMASGRVLYPAALVKMVQDSGVTPADVWALIERGLQNNVNGPDRTKPGPKPKEQS